MLEIRRGIMIFFFEIEIGHTYHLVKKIMFDMWKGNMKVIRDIVMWDLI